MGSHGTTGRPARVSAGRRVWGLSAKRPTVGVPGLAAGEGSDFVTAAGRGGDGRTVAIVNTHGQIRLIRLQDIETGAVRRTLPGPPGLAGESGGLQLKTAEAAVDSASNLVAVVDDKGSVVVTDLNDGRIVDTRLGSDAVFVASAGRRLLVQRKGGSLEGLGSAWEDSGAAALRGHELRASGRERVGGRTGRSCWPTSTAA